MFHETAAIIMPVIISRIYQGCSSNKAATAQRINKKCVISPINHGISHHYNLIAIFLRVETNKPNSALPNKYTVAGTGTTAISPE